MLVLVSGGVESTSLWKKLLESGNRVTAVHVQAPNRANRHMQELRAVTEVAKVLGTTFRHVLYLGPYHRDAEVHLALLPNLLLSTGETMFMRGLCAEDKTEHDHGKRLYIARAVRDVLTLGGHKGFPTDPEDLSPDLTHLHLTKREHMEYLGPELLAKTWSCLAPVRGQPCRTCRTCVLRQEVPVTPEEEELWRSIPEYACVSPVEPDQGLSSR